MYRLFLHAFLLSLIVLPIILLPACPQPPAAAQVLRIIDGDTIVIEGGHYVRYIGIDAPEKDESYYSEAKEANRKLVQGKNVRLEKDTSDKDKYGRLLRYVYNDDVFVNAEIIKQGYAYAKAYPPDTKYQAYLQAMESAARENRAGMWAQKQARLSD